MESSEPEVRAERAGELLAAARHDDHDLARPQGAPRRGHVGHDGIGGGGPSRQRRRGRVDADHQAPVTARHGDLAQVPRLGPAPVGLLRRDEPAVAGAPQGERLGHDRAVGLALEPVGEPGPDLDVRGGSRGVAHGLHRVAPRRDRQGAQAGERRCRGAGNLRRRPGGLVVVDDCLRPGLQHGGDRSRPFLLRERGRGRGRRGQRRRGGSRVGPRGDVRADPWPARHLGEGGEQQCRRHQAGHLGQPSAHRVGAVHARRERLAEIGIDLVVVGVVGVVVGRSLGPRVHATTVGAVTGAGPHPAADRVTRIGGDSRAGRAGVGQGQTTRPAPE